MTLIYESRFTSGFFYFFPYTYQEGLKTGEDEFENILRKVKSFIFLLNIQNKIIYYACIIFYFVHLE